jgi:biotin carboxyl carrier protein
MRLRAFLAGDETREVEVHRRGDVYEVTVDGACHVVDTRKLEGDLYSLLLDGCSYEIAVEDAGETYTIRHGGFQKTVRLVDPLRTTPSSAMAASGQTVVTAVMPGKVVRLLVVEGQEVEEGQGLLVLEAMKMENEVSSPRTGRVTRIRAAEGQQVETGEDLVVVE